jgi:putative YjhG/YagF family dehydratase
VGEALGLSLPHSALAPSGQPIWLDMARRSAQTLVMLSQQHAAQGKRTKWRSPLCDGAVRNAMTVFAAFGGSTNLLLHLPAIVFSAGLHRPTIDEWTEINRRVPRLVSVLPNGPVNHPTVRVYLAGGVPEVMLHLRALDLLDLSAPTITGMPLGESLTWWESSPRRHALRALLHERDGVDPDDVILSPRRAAELGVTSTMCFPRGNLAPEGSCIKSTAIDRHMLDADGVYRHVGPAKVFCREADAIAAIKGQGSKTIEPGDVMVLMGRGPMGSGMEEVFQLTSSLRYLSWGREVALITDARFSGVSTGACIGMVAPEALSGGPLGRLRDGDLVQIVIDTRKLEGSIDCIGQGDQPCSPQQGADLLAGRAPHPDLAPDARLPAETRLWAAMQRASGGPWAGCVFDVDEIVRRLDAGG